MSVSPVRRRLPVLGALSVALVASLALLAGSAHADGVGSNPQIRGTPRSAPGSRPGSPPARRSS